MEAPGESFLRRLESWIDEGSDAFFPWGTFNLARARLLSLLKECVCVCVTVADSGPVSVAVSGPVSKDRSGDRCGVPLGVPSVETVAFDLPRRFLAVSGPVTAPESISAGGNFGRPPITVDRGDTSEVSVGCPVGSQKTSEVSRPVTVAVSSGSERPFSWLRARLHSSGG